MWVKALTNKMKKTDMEKLIETSGKVCNEYDRRLVESILEVTFNANIGLVEEMRGDVKMGKTMLKIMQPVILELEKKAETRGVEKGIEKGKILGAVEILRTFNSNDEIKKIIMEKYHLTENDAEKYLSL